MQQGGGRAPMLRSFQVLTQQSWLTLSSDLLPFLVGWAENLQRSLQSNVAAIVNPAVELE